ncbi:MAG TPA: YbhB/YbcL family Raf kinase inhibitor-like protein [Syntrophobacteraceae bacterium]|nr:YbhB/YbcL family Raf kinase inhibitor-like protein [Syntrophobacteraceae bacterium]
MMKKYAVVFIFMCILATGTCFAAGFELTSPDLHKGGKLNMEQVFNGFGCTGGNISPALMWQGAPKDTKSFAVTVYDPDAPTGSGWWHWVIFNIPANISVLPKNAGAPASGLAPAGSLQGRTDYGAPGYGGACPPQGDKPHRYIFTVYALDIDKLPLDANASAAMVGFNLNRHALAKASITVKFAR